MAVGSATTVMGEGGGSPQDNDSPSPLPIEECGKEAPPENLLTSEDLKLVTALPHGPIALVTEEHRRLLVDYFVQPLLSNKELMAPGRLITLLQQVLLTWLGCGISVFSGLVRVGYAPAKKRLYLSQQLRARSLLSP